MEFGIKLLNGSWIEFLSEYHNNKRVITFRNRDEAELYAQNIELNNYVIEEYNDPKTFRT